MAARTLNQRRRSWFSCFSQTCSALRGSWRGAHFIRRLARRAFNAPTSMLMAVSLLFPRAGDE